MKSAIFVCSLAILGACSAETLDEARTRAQEITQQFSTEYSNIYNDAAYMALSSKISDLQTSVYNVQDTNQKIRDVYDPLYMTYMSSGTPSECSYIAQLFLTLDVQQGLNNYQGSMAYSQAASDFQTLQLSLISEPYYSLFTGIYNDLYNDNQTVDSINALITKLQTDAAAATIRSKQIIVTLGNQVDQLKAKFVEAENKRVADALHAMDVIKQNYDSCVLYQIY